MVRVESQTSKKLPQILSNLQPIQAKKKKLWASNSTHSRYFTICALHFARVPDRLQNIILTQNYLNYTFLFVFFLPNHSSICVRLPACERLSQAFLW